jgi:hypothetical protein
MAEALKVMSVAVCFFMLSPDQIVVNVTLDPLTLFPRKVRSTDERTFRSIAAHGRLSTMPTLVEPRQSC